jgi:acetyl-CoA carboxylase carboxyltransferase component
VVLGAATPVSALMDLVFVVSEKGRRLTSPDHPADEGGRGPGVSPGAAHLVAEDEAECWRAVRAVLSHLPSHSGEAPPFQPAADPSDRGDAALQTLVPESADGQYDMREVVTRLLDDGRFLEVQPFFAQNVLVGFGRLGGHVAGVVANQPRVLAGALDAAASGKAARFVRLCDAFNVPLVSLVDTPGSPAGTAHGVALLRAYAEATVPKLAVITRRAVGDAYATMSPKQLGADLNLAWPSAEIGDAVAGPYAAAERGHVDAVIEPRETRRALVRSLELCVHRTVEPPSRRHTSIPL